MSISEQEVRELVIRWYKLLDVHSPMVELLPMLAENGLEMKFPEATLHGMADFESWYQRVIRLFFDEVHSVKEVSVKTAGDRADVHIVVEWQASVWAPPAAKSERITLDADQDWVVKSSVTTGKPVIEQYVVNSLNYHEGSAKL